MSTDREVENALGWGTDESGVFLWRNRTGKAARRQPYKTQQRTKRGTSDVLARELATNPALVRGLHYRDLMARYEISRETANRAIRIARKLAGPAGSFLTMREGDE